MNVLITICARGGSKGIPGKNIKNLNNKPLLHFTLEHAFEFAKLYSADIQLSTDSAEILDCAADLGYTTKYKRPDALGTDSVGKIEVIRHAWLWKEEQTGKSYDYVLDMDVTSPLRTMTDLTSALKMLESRPEALNIFSVNRAARNPYFNMVELSEDGYARVSKNSSIIKSRQSAPPVYDMNASFYFFSREFMEEGYQRSTTNRSLVFVMDHICFDLDEPVDFMVLEIMLRDGLLDFQL